MHTQETDVVVVGAGLSGLVAAIEIADRGRKVVLVEQEPAASLGGQAFWSLGGLFMVGTPEQRRAGIRDSRELAWQDWLGTAGFDRDEDLWPKRWAEAYVDFASGEKRAWLTGIGVKFFATPGWAERGGSLATGAGNSVPRFHLTWGTGPGILEPFVARLAQLTETGLVTTLFRHRVGQITTSAGAVSGVSGVVLEPSSAQRGESSSRTAIGEFEITANAVVVTSGGIGGNLDLVRANWPARLGDPPARLLSGVPDYVDGSMIEVCRGAGATTVNDDRMWHYTEGVANWNPIWPNHGIRIIPGPSSMWLDAHGRRLPAPLFPGFDTMATLEHLTRTGQSHSWFLLNQRIIEREFALSGSEQNPDITSKKIRAVIRGRLAPGAPGPVEAFKRHGEDFVVRDDLAALVRGMNELTGSDLVDHEALEAEVVARDREVANRFSKDQQITAVRGARRYLPDRLIRVAAPHRILDPAAGPLIAVRLSILTRKTLGGIHTDLDGQALDAAGQPVPGLYAAGEAAGFGGGGMHGYRALEGTFLGGCLYSGRQAGRGVAAAISA